MKGNKGRKKTENEKEEEEKLRGRKGVASIQLYTRNTRRAAGDNAHSVCRRRVPAGVLASPAPRLTRSWKCAALQLETTGRRRDRDGNNRNHKPAQQQLFF